MFQTDPILWLQAFAHPLLTALMRTITALGATQVLMAVVTVVLLGVHLRKGMVLGQWVIAAGVGAELLKRLWRLPRPWHADAAVRLLADGAANPSPFHGADGAGPWALPHPDVSVWAAVQPDVSFGLPSGHTALTVALFGGLALLFPRRATYTLAALMIPAMMLSRMYLGLHFAGDVLAGLLLGGALLALTYPLARVWIDAPGSTRDTALPLAAALLFVLCAGVLSPKQLGPILGFQAALCLLLARGLPPDAATLEDRVQRCLPAPLLYLGTRLVFDLLTRAAPPDAYLPTLLDQGLRVLVMLTVTVAIGRRRGWFAPAPDAAAA